MVIGIKNFKVEEEELSCLEGLGGDVFGWGGSELVNFVFR